MIDEKLRAKLNKIVERQNSDSKLNDSQAESLKNELKNHIVELELLKTEFEDLMSDYEPKVENLNALVVQAKELKTTLEAKKDELHHYYTTVCKPLFEAEYEAEEAQKEVNQELQAIFESIVNEDDVIDALNTMTQMTGQVKTRCRNQWEDAQKTLIDAFKALEKAGWYSKALDEITELNWNRQRNVGETTARDFDYDDFYAITRVE